LDGDGFILQVHGVFTRIRSGLLWQLWVAARLDLQRRRHAQIYSNGYNSDEWKTLRVLASIYKSNRLRNGRMDKSTPD
jgi:hypothetical protein